MCREVYRSAREALESKRGISARELEALGKVFMALGHPPEAERMDGGLSIGGQAALDGPDWASRMVMFRLYYLGLASYETARHFLGLSEHSWVNWSEQEPPSPRQRASASRMFPPRKYFTNGA